MLNIDKLSRLVAALFIMIMFCGSVFAGDPNEVKVSRNLVVKKNAKGDYITEYEIHNGNSKLQRVYRPFATNNNCGITGLGRFKTISFEDDVVAEKLYERPIALRPNCKIHMNLGGIKIKNKTGHELEHTAGIFPAEVLKNDKDEGTIEVSKKYVPPIIVSGDKEKEKNFLEITVAPVSKVGYLDKPVLFQICIENKTDRPLRFHNYFSLYEYRHYFKFNIELIDKDGKVTVIERDIFFVAAISPHFIDGWMTLFPGERLSTVVDASKEFKMEGNYLVSVTFRRGRVLVYPKSEKPYYAKKYKWDSNKIPVAIVKN